MPPRPKNKKSLAEELAELANPAPLTDIDPDADIFQSGPTLEGSDDELMDAVHQSNNRPATRSFKRAAAAAVDIILEGPDYAGKKSSSKAIFGDEDSEEEEEEEEEEESDIEDELHQNGMKGLHKQTANSSSDDDDDGDDDDGQEEDDEMARLEREYREMQAAETSTVKQLQDRVCKERRKAVAVSNQTNLWKKALEARILLQKALAGGNRFPRGSAYTIAVEHSEKAGDALKSLASEASETLSSVCDVLEALMQRNPAVAGAHAAAGVQGGGEGGSKRKRDDNEEDEDDASDKGWKRLEGCYKDMQPFRDSSIDRWHRKTVLQTGTAAVHGNLRVLNQSVSTQIATLMADPTRLVQRTRMVKGSVKTLCEPAAVVMNNNNKDVAEANKDSEAAIAGDEGDPETFDDTEFYQTLLKEFLDNSQGINNSIPTGRKQRKQVDRRASKGRKIRYHVHEKLVNFMTPVELKSPLYTSNLFANLFGGK